MAHEQKSFLKRLSISWKHAFPFLEPVELDEIPRVPKGCNYRCDAYGETRGLYYFLTLDFSQRRRGDFTIGITISGSRERSTLNPAEASEPSPYTIGSFGIWQFLGRPRFVWALVDLEAESNAIFNQLGEPAMDLGKRPSPNMWRPSTYKQPFEKIADEAIVHVNEILRTKVFPILEITVPTATTP